jgi:hypothetical protein
MLHLRNEVAERINRLLLSVLVVVVLVLVLVLVFKN